MIVGHRLMVHFALRVHLPLGVQQPQEVELAVDIAGLRRLDASHGGGQDPLFVQMNDPLALLGLRRLD